MPQYHFTNSRKKMVWRVILQPYHFLCCVDAPMFERRDAPLCGRGTPRPYDYACKYLLTLPSILLAMSCETSAFWNFSPVMCS